MKLKVPRKVRSALYVATALGSPVVAVLVDQAVVPTWVGLLWAAEVTAVASLAGVNVSGK